MERRILVTGEYSHKDFRGLLQSSCAFTMVPLKRVRHLEGLFDLVIVAEAFPNQISSTEVEKLQVQFPLTPFVALLGSWCEGETRTGKPWPGVLRIYRHQWQGRFDHFLNQLRQNGAAIWHDPPTSSLADRILRMESAHAVGNNHSKIAGISASRAAPFEMLQDAFQTLAWKAVWLEMSQLKELDAAWVNLLCFDANQIGDELAARIAHWRQRFTTAQTIVVANFPRDNEIEFLRKRGVSKIVSKPFELVDLQFAVQSCLQTSSQL